MSGKLEGKIAVITGGTTGMGLLDEDKLGFADFSGNRQYITLGNLSKNPQAFIFLMDYANGRRVKLWGTARVVEGDSALEKRLSDPDYPSKVERVILFTVEAWDVNCSQHVHQRFSRRQIAPLIEQLQQRIDELESEVESLKSKSSVTSKLYEENGHVIQ